MEPRSQKRLKLSSSSATTTTTPIPNNVVDAHEFYKKTQLCRRFREGFCNFGSKCKYAHGIADLKPRSQQHQHQLCRMFLHNKHCSYGHTCRFLHVHANPNISHGSQPPARATGRNPGSSREREDTRERRGVWSLIAKIFSSLSNGWRGSGSEFYELEKLDGYSSAKCTAMQTSNAATNVSTSSLHKHKNEPSPCISSIGHPSSTAATNASTTSSLHKYEQYGVAKFIFKENNLQKISRVYADWI